MHCMVTEKGSWPWDSKGAGFSSREGRSEEYKTVMGRVRFFVKRIDDGRLVKGALGVETLGGSKTGDTAYCFVESGEKFRVVRLEECEFESAERNGSRTKGIKDLLEDVETGGTAPDESTHLFPAETTRKRLREKADP